MTIGVLMAAQALDERKSAACDRALVSGDDLRLLASGFDLDMGELFGVADLASEAFLPGMLVMGPRNICLSAWVDGLLTGLLLAKLRADDKDG
jgi:hypothetical protein